MDENGFWNVFKDTGDPLCWLICRRSSACTDAGTSGSKAEENIIKQVSGVTPGL